MYRRGRQGKAGQDGQKRAPFNVAIAVEGEALTLRVDLAQQLPAKAGHHACVAQTFGTVGVPGVPDVVVQLTVWRKP